MVEILSAVVAVAVVVLIWLGFVLFKKQSQLASLGQKFNDLSANLSIKDQELNFIKDENKNLQEQNIQNIQKITQLTTKLESANEINTQLKERQDELDNKTREYFELKTKQMSENLLNLSSKEMAESSAKILESLIAPLKDEINKYQKSNLEINNTFKVNFENLKSETKGVMTQAHNLAEALKSNKKILGNWGEIQLDSVLQSSGLILGVNYDKQVACKDENGNQKYLDAVVKFDENKKAIIDAKCSLINYNEYHNATDESLKEGYAKALAKDIRNHIDNLSSKDYAFLDSKNYEYVFMFIPNDNMLFVALGADSTLYEYAYEKGIFITTPLTLLMALKTVYICWRNLKSDENAARIFSEAGKIYDKFDVFIKNYERLENQVIAMSKVIEDGKTTLYQGRGNLISKFENLKKLGAKTTKTLPYAISDDELIS
ncbi:MULTISPECIES: DNA recombination protein RmuC [Campylobacter]|uniref:DNA recombination protein RmuC n=1 Tax=Campylobacter TaxID=194 RepID=UPI0015D81FE9|nr:MULTISPECIES: DNA recombination protein RmuC [unclassified Campylobacter]MCR8679228.1 DNA recombination protein RmuC [Campylobacter sp. RM19072]MCR8696734.1 DNA recombination protein RmuC [Campylobacter sp. RM19073]